MVAAAVVVIMMEEQKRVFFWGFLTPIGQPNTLKAGLFISVILSTSADDEAVEFVHFRVDLCFLNVENSPIWH